jgi:methenyltetrahydrofolate cyclohydrolase
VEGSGRADGPTRHNRRVRLLEVSVQAWLDELANRGPAPGGGAAAAITAAMAAAIVAMAGRLSSEWPEARGVVAQASSLRRRLAELAQTDADVYRETLRVLERRAEIPAERRDHELGQALSRAAQAPLTIAETAADVAVLAAEAAERADARLRPDADVAAALAAAAAQAAARLVEVNLSAVRDDARVARARTAAEAAVRAMRRSFPPS